MKKIKDYKDVMVGDTAYENPDAGGIWDSVIGIILWKGDFEDLRKSDYRGSLENWVKEDPEALEEETIKNYDFVVVNVADGDYPYGPTVFNYNNDPSGVVCFTETVTKKEIKQAIKTGNFTPVQRLRGIFILILMRILWIIYNLVMLVLQILMIPQMLFTKKWYTRASLFLHKDLRKSGPGNFK